MASSEAFFDPQIDSLYNFRLDTNLNQAELIKMDFIKYGQINAWLTSPIFNLEHARSREAENAIIQAKQLQLQDNPNKEQVNRIHQELINALAENDPFWPRWIYFAEENGVVV
ncbi:MAG: hypothetical protein LBU17_09925 [Treponema sp.]|nr:hypothetical protein [Treponema sp.]